MRSPCVCHAKSVVNCVALKSTHATASVPVAWLKADLVYGPTDLANLHVERARVAGLEGGGNNNKKKISALYFDFDRCLSVAVVVRVCVSRKM